MKSRQFEVAAPAGVSTSDTTLAGTPIPGRIQLVRGVSLDDGIDLRLGTGQPLKPMVLKYTFAIPLPAASIATIVRGDPSRVPVVPVKSALSADRMTLTASITHLSWYSVVVEAIEPAVAGFLGVRGEAPHCGGKRPDWATDIIYISQKGDPPILVCSGRDSKNPQVLVVKLTNNRGTGMAITSSVKWKKQTSGGAGGVLATAGEWMSKLSDPAADRTVFLMPGQQVEFDYDKPASGTTIALQGVVSTSALAYGVAWQALEEVPFSKQVRTIAAAAFLTVCFNDAIADPLFRAKAIDVATTIASVVKCGITHYNDIVTVLRSRLSSGDWAKISQPLYRAGSLVFRRLNAYLTLASVAFTLADAIADVLQDPNARRITIFTRVDRPSIARFTGDWRVHGYQLTISRNGTGRENWNSGPCNFDINTGGPSVMCTTYTTVRFTASSDGKVLTGKILTLSKRGSDGSSWPLDDPGARVGDTFELRPAGQGLLIRKEVVSGISAADREASNPYLCSVDHPPANTDVCGA
ncbi:hypothetical protein ACQPYH_20020 [Kribbella sp. CA-245084]|uniref:hypothetical protein n=1 Tax=Kribbella sp. CA-245084 TaxID=3239940 RepID=UPI003D8DD744